MNKHGEVGHFQLTSTEGHDLTPVKQGFLNGLQGAIVVDSGYVSLSVQKALRAQGLIWITKPRVNAETQLTSSESRLYRQRQTVERTFSRLKLWHHLLGFRLRTKASLIVNTLSALIVLQLRSRLRSFLSF